MQFQKGIGQCEGALYLINLTILELWPLLQYGGVEMILVVAAVVNCPASCWSQKTASTLQPPFHPSAEADPEPVSPDSSVNTQTNLWEGGLVVPYL